MTPPEVLLGSRVAVPVPRPSVRLAGQLPERLLRLTEREDCGAVPVVAPLSHDDFPMSGVAPFGQKANLKGADVTGLRSHRF